MKKNKRTLTPKLRFPEFLDAPRWGECKLGKLVDISSGKSPSQYALSINGTYPFVKVEDLNNCTKYQVTSREYCDDAGGAVPKGSILFPKRGAAIELNKIRITAVDILLDTNLMAITPRDSAASEFLFYYLCHVGLSQIADTSSIPQINNKHIIPFSISVPLLSEQQKIADCLSSLDDWIAAEGRKLEALKAHKKGLMQQLFPQSGETQPRLRFPEFKNAGGWKPKKFGRAATFFNGRAYRKDELLDEGKYRVLRVGNFFTNDQWYHSDLELDETKYCVEGDLLYAWSASFGPRIWHGERVIYHYHIWKVVEGEDINKRFLFVCLDRETERMKAQSANGLGLLHITKGTIEDWDCVFPEIDEQIRIAGYFYVLDTQIAAQAAKIDSLKTHKRGLMQQLFPVLEEQ